MITKEGKAGTLQSNDCLVTVLPCDKVEIEISSILYDQFGETIETVAKNTLHRLKEEKIHLKIEDRAAPNSTITRRIEEAVERAQ